MAVTYILSAHSDSLGKQTAPIELEFITKVCKERLPQSTLFIFFVEVGNFAVWVGSQSVLLHRTIRSGQQVPAKRMKCYLSKVKFLIPMKNLSVLCLVIFAGCGNILFCPNCWWQCIFHGAETILIKVKFSSACISYIYFFYINASLEVWKITSSPAYCKLVISKHQTDHSQKPEMEQVSPCLLP